IKQGGKSTLDRNEDQDRHDEDTYNQQNCLNHLHVGGALHAADKNVDGHDDADDTDDYGLPVELVDIQKNGNQGASACHLGNQIEQGNEHGSQSSSHADWLLAQTEGQNVRHRKAANVTQWLSNEHQRNQPSYEEAHRVKEAIVAVQCHRTDDAQEGRCGEVVTGNC